MPSRCRFDEYEKRSASAMKKRKREDVKAAKIEREKSAVSELAAALGPMCFDMRTDHQEHEL